MNNSILWQFNVDIYYSLNITKEKERLTAERYDFEMLKNSKFCKKPMGDYITDDETLWSNNMDINNHLF